MSIIISSINENQKPCMTLLNLQDEMHIFCVVANHFPNHFRRVAQGVVVVVLAMLVVLVLVLVILH